MGLEARDALGPVLARSMHMSRILVLYASRHGQTAKIASRIAERLRAHHHEVEVRNAADPIPAAAIDRAEAFILGASVQFGRHLPEVMRFVRERRELLAQRPSAFFSVSMAAARAAVARDELDHYVARFVGAGWYPGQLALFAGALAYRSYNPILRFVMRLIAARNGESTDTSTNHEYTDWAAVDTFAERFAEKLERKMPADAA